MRSTLPLALACACTELPADAPDPVDSEPVELGLPIAGPGLGAVTFQESELFHVVGWVDDTTGVPFDDPDAPITFSRPFGTNVAALHDGYLVVIFAPDSGFGPGGLLFYDVSDPREPVLVNRVYEPQGRTAAFREAHSMGFAHRDGRKLAVFQTGLGIAFWDLTDVMDPQVVSELALPGVFFGDYASVAWQLSWQGPHVYVAAADLGVFVVDATDVHAPVLASRAGGPNPVPPSELGGFRVGPIFAVGNLLVISSMDNSAGFAVLDISDPLQPALLSAVTRDQPNAYATCLGGGWLVNANRGGGAPVVLHDLRDPFDVRTHASDLVVDGQLYCATQDHHVFLGNEGDVVKVDVRDPDAPSILGRGSLDRHDADHGQVTPFGNLVYVGNDHGSGSGLMVHDLAPDTTPPEVQWASPARDEEQVPVGSRIGLVFSDNLTVEHVHAGSVRLRTAEGDPVPVGFAVQQNVVNLAPSSPLQPDTAYVIEVVAGGVTDWAGNPVATAWSSTFRTAQAPPASVITGLVAHWPLDEDHGTRVSDQSGNGNVGRVVGQGSFTGAGLALGGVDGAVQIPSPEIPVDGDLTVSLWVHDLPAVAPAADPADWTTGQVLVDAATASNGWALALVEGRPAAFVGGGVTLIGPTALDPGARHHLLLHRGGQGESVLSVDGVEVAREAGPAPIASKPPTLWLGSLEGRDGFVAGTLSDVRLYDRQLEPDEVARLVSGEDQGTRLRVRLAPLAVEVGTEVTLTPYVAGPGSPQLTWNLGDGSARRVQPDAAPLRHTWTEPGHHEVVVSATNGFQRASATALVTVHRPLPARPPTQARTLALDEARDRLWVVNRDHGTLSELALGSGVLLAEHPTCATPLTVTLAPDGSPEVGCPGDDVVLVEADRTWVVDADRHRLRVDVDGEAPREVDLQGLPGRLSRSADGATAWIPRRRSPEGEAQVWSFDRAGALERTFVFPADTSTVDAEDRARGLPNELRVAAPSPDGAELWIPAKLDNVLRGSLRDGLPLDFQSTVRSVLLRLDLRTGREVAGGRIDLNNRAPAVDVAFSPRGDWVFAVLQGSHEVMILDAYTGEPVGALQRAGVGPDGIVLSSDGRRAWVHGALSRSVVVYDTADLVSGRSFSAARLAEHPTVSVEVLPPEVLRGKTLFHEAADGRLGRDGYLSCASCHPDGGEDGRVWDFTDRGEGLRNTIDLRGRAGTGHGPLHWTANFDEVQDFENDIRGPFGGAGLMSTADFQAGTRNDPLGDPKAGVSAELDALAAYVASLTEVPESPWRPAGGLSEEAEAGALTFADLGCDTCHAGFDAIDPERALHDVGTLSAASGARRGGPLTGLDVPTLRGVWATPPYLHNGSAPTLRDVLVTRNPSDAHGVTSPLSEEALDALVRYLLELD